MWKFKEAARHLWNGYLVACEPASIPVMQTFELIERELLRELVLRKLSRGDEADSYRKAAVSGIAVRAKEYLVEIPIQSGTVSANENVRWTDSLLWPITDLPDLRFFDFFDWNTYENRDFSYVRAISANSNQYFLIEAANCMFFYMDNAQLHRDSGAK